MENFPERRRAYTSGVASGTRTAGSVGRKFGRAFGLALKTAFEVGSGLQKVSHARAAQGTFARHVSHTRARKAGMEERAFSDRAGVLREEKAVTQENFAIAQIKVA